MVLSEKLESAVAIGRLETKKSKIEKISEKEPNR